MDIKKVSQYSLIILLVITSLLFYYQYFADDVKKVDNNVSENVLEKKDAEVNLYGEDKNII